MSGQIIICRGTGRRYIVRVRFYGHRRYMVLGKPTKSYKVAVARMAKAFPDSKLYKRADVLFEQDWYDPVQLCELVRR